MQFQKLIQILGTANEGRSIGTYECTDYFVKLHYRPHMHQPKLHHTVMLSRSEASRCPARETFTAFQFRVAPAGSRWRRRSQVYLNPDGRMLVQYVNQADDFSDSAFTMPALTLTGSATNS